MNLIKTMVFLVFTIATGLIGIYSYILWCEGIQRSVFEFNSNTSLALLAVSALAAAGCWVYYQLVKDYFEKYMASQSTSSNDDDALDSDIIEAIVRLGHDDLREKIASIHEEVIHRRDETL